MQNIVLYAVENGVHRPLVSCSPEDESRFFAINSAGNEYARQCRARGVELPPLQVVREEREADAGGQTLVKQDFTLLDPATFAARGKPVKTLADLLKKASAKDKE